MKKTTICCLLFWLFCGGCAPLPPRIVKSRLLAIENKFTSNLVVNRREHTATLLPSGKVLLAGGETYIAELNRFVPLSRCEVYYPAKEMFFTNTIIDVARSRHTATLMLNGNVLIAGGRDEKQALFDTEIYYSKQNFSKPGPIMENARYGHTANLLANGDVLIANGISRTKALSAVEAYSLKSNSFTVVGHTRYKGANRTATQIQRDKILFTGGWYNENGIIYFSKSAEIYDTVSNSSLVLPPMQDARAFHSATLLFDGKVLIVGGKNHAGDLKTTEIFDPETNQFYLTGQLNIARSFHTAVAADYQRVLIIGGSSKRKVLKEVEVYDVVEKRFQLRKSINTPRKGHTATLLQDNKVLIAGGSFGERINQVHLTSFSLVGEILRLRLE